MPHIDLGGRQFKLREEPPKAGRLLVVARAERKGGQAAMAAYLDLLESMLDPDHDVEEFEAAVSDMDDAEIAQALTQATGTYDADPSSPARRSSSRSSGGRQTGAATSKVVSFSKGTVQVHEAS